MKIKINGSYYDYIVDFAFSQSLDSVASSFSFTAKFDKENAIHRELFRPLSFKKVEFYDDLDKKFFTGVILNSSFSATAAPDVVQLAGYSTSGVLEDSTVPYSLYPLESNKRNLREIAERFLKPFNIKVIVDKSAVNDVNSIYDKTSADPKDKIKEYLSKLAAQRNVILGHDENGSIVFFKPNFDSKPKFYYNEGNCVAIVLDVNGQEMHSELTILRQPEKKKTPKKKKKKAEDADLDEDGFPKSWFEDDPPKPKDKKPKEKPLYYDTIHNPFVESYRPTVEILTEGEGVSTKNAARNYLADELKNIRFSVDLNRWDDVKVGDLIEIFHPDLFIAEKLKLVIESFEKEENSAGRKMSLNLVLPEAFTGEVPKNIFL